MERAVHIENGGEEVVPGDQLAKLIQQQRLPQGEGSLHVAADPLCRKGWLRLQGTRLNISDHQ